MMLWNIAKLMSLSNLRLGSSESLLLLRFKSLNAAILKEEQYSGV